MPDRHTQGEPEPPLPVQQRAWPAPGEVAAAGPRQARVPRYKAGGSLEQAAAAVFDECLEQILCNAAGLLDPADAWRVEHVHQLRVGIRRLRSALRGFRGPVAPPPDEWVTGLRRLFAELGDCRDRDTHDQGVAAGLVEAGAPPLPDPADALRTPAQIVGDTGTQQMLHGWMAWRASLDRPAVTVSWPLAAPPSIPSAAATLHPAAAGDRVRAAKRAAGNWHKAVHKRWCRWHRRIVAQAARFDELDEPTVHQLRRRIKRLRYMAEFLSPILDPRALRRTLEVLAPVQDGLGELNDLRLARARYEALRQTLPQAWFALGWIAARTQAVRGQLRPGLQRLVRTPVPSRR